MKYTSIFLSALALAKAYFTCPTKRAESYRLFLSNLKIFNYFFNTFDGKEHKNKYRNVTRHKKLWTLLSISSMIKFNFPSDSKVIIWARIDYGISLYTWLQTIIAIKIQKRENTKWVPMWKANCILKLTPRFPFHFGFPKWLLKYRPRIIGSHLL